MGSTKIEWTDYSLGAAKMGLYGCSHASVGCSRCWAESMASRFEAEHGYPPGIVANGRWTGRVVTDASKIAPAFESLPKRKRCRVFAPSSGDLFHPAVPDSFIMKVFVEMSKAVWSHHIFQLLTKRPDRILRWFREDDWEGWGYRLPHNIQIGGSFSTQADLDRGVGDLLRVPAAVRFISYEPGLSEIQVPAGIDWLLIGCESGPNRRPFNRYWARYAVEQCRDLGIAPFVKQLPDSCGRVIHAGHPEWPEWGVQEFPEVPRG